MKEWLSKYGKHFWYLPLLVSLWSWWVFFSVPLRLGDVFSPIFLSAFTYYFFLKCTGRLTDKDDPFVDWSQHLFSLKRVKKQVRAQPCQGWGREFVDYFRVSSIIRRLSVKKLLRTGVSLIKPKKKVRDNAGNQTHGSPLLGIHSYQEGGAKTDSPKNRTAKDPKRTESLFTTPLALIVEHWT